ncbi:transcription initiation protein SPT3 homolog [Anoplophora glabripennis]|uniref:transcription initiation protein SPT3 homolog n=1 Tax=Anoplophora glabripennis TaxID=217634 RepID=UPI00087453F7|nr:transcription initiation protein SPT3 homolog [Anoplophora glabripennis]
MKTSNTGKMEAQKITYYNEISLMMFGFGDSHKPNPDTVRLVESIVLKQLRTIVQEALKYSDGKNLRGEELVFLMRHNKHKMIRFVKYLMNKQNKYLLQKMQLNMLEENPVQLPKGDLMEFIERIDETGEFTDLSTFDEIEHERQVRADRISQALDQKKYLEFSKARCASFNSRDTIHRSLEKLRAWIDPKKDINFNADALDVLAYYAYQTVAEITDYALLVRMDSKCGTDALKHLSGSYYTATMFNGEHRFGGANPDYSKVHSSQPPISVNEIKEVMRRVHTPQAGRLNFGGNVPETHYLFAL